MMNFTSALLSLITVLRSYRKQTYFLLATLILVVLSFSNVFSYRDITDFEKFFACLGDLASKPTSRSEEITIIDIDKASNEKYGPWPWDREKFAQLIEILTSFKAKVIAVPILFSETSTESSDDAFVSSIIAARNVVLGSTYSPRIYPFTCQGRANCSEYLKFGYLDLERDEDGRIVGIKPLIGESGITHKSFALVVAEEYLGEGLLPASHDNSIIRINSHNPKRTFERVSVKDIFDGSNKHNIAGRILIVDPSFMSIYEKMPSGLSTLAEVHANVVASIINNNWTNH